MKKILKLKKPLPVNLPAANDLILQLMKRQTELQKEHIHLLKSNCRLRDSLNQAVELLTQVFQGDNLSDRVIVEFRDAAFAAMKLQEDQ